MQVMSSEQSKTAAWDTSTIYSEHILGLYAPQLEPLVRKAGLPTKFLHDPGMEISVEDYARILELGSIHIDPLIGFEIGRNLRPCDIGALGHALSACATVGQMLEYFVKYLYVYSHANITRLAVGTSTAVISYSFPIKSLALRRHDEDLAISGIVNFVRQLTGQDFVPTKVDLIHEVQSTRYDDYFGCEVCYGSDDNRVLFDRTWLNVPILPADPSLLAALTYYLNHQLHIRQDGTDLRGKLRHLIATSLGRNGAHIRQISKELGISVRSLQRHLVGIGTTFSDEVESCRKALFEELSTTGNHTMTEIALMLGYSELSSLSRAARAWKQEELTAQNR